LHEHDRRLVLLDELEQIGGRSPARSTSGRLAADERVERIEVAVECSGSVIDSTGTWIFRSSGLRTPASTIGALPLGADHVAADLLERFCVADRADALDLALVFKALSRSSVSAMWEPRLVAATAWISSRMMLWVCSSIVRAWLVRMR
jgi:hypothetical protein